MTSYRAIENFKDLLDNGYKYRVGDSFPHSGYTPDKERIEELLSSNNKRGRAVIEEVEELMNQPVEAEAKEEAVVDTPKPKRRGRKKNAE